MEGGSASKSMMLIVPVVYKLERKRLGLEASDTAAGEARMRQLTMISMLDNLLDGTA